MGFKQTALAFVREAYENYKIVYPGLDPIAHHTAGTARPGDSFFTDGIQTVEDVLSLIETHIEELDWYGSYEEGRGHFTVVLPFVIGTRASSPPFPDEEYVIVRDHGGLVPFGKAKNVLTETNIITIALTPENMEGHAKRQFALASLYPGDVDSAKNWDGLKEGDVVRGDELLRRGIGRVKQAT